MFRKVTVMAILLALIVAAFPAMGVLADSPKAEKLVSQWEVLTTAFDAHSFQQQTIHRDVTNWLKDHKDVSAADKAAIQMHLYTADKAFAAAQVLLTKHAGFDAKGKVIDIVAATKTVKDMKFYLQLHAAALKNLMKDHIA